MVLWRAQSSSACFPPANQPVERSKLVLAVHPAVVPAMRSAMRLAVRHPNQIYKQKIPEKLRRQTPGSSVFRPLLLAFSLRLPFLLFPTFS